MKLYLHIGTEKTGTTTIQHFLESNRPALLKRGYFVPKSLGPGNHRWLPVLAYRDDFADEFIRGNNLTDPGRRRQAMERKREELARELAAVPVNQVVMTSEHLHSRLRSVEEVRAVRSLLAPWFDEIEVIVYLRDPFSMAVSLYSTALRAGAMDADVFPADNPYMVHAADYRRLIEMWAEVFGRDKLRIRIFEREQLKGGDVLADFAAVIGLDLAGLPPPPRQNESLSTYAIQLLREFNVLLRARGLPDPAAARLRNRLVPVLETRFAELPAFRGSAETREAYARQYGPGVDWVRRTFFPGRPVLFKPVSVRGPDQWKPRPDIVCVAAAMLELMEQAG